MNLFLNCFNAPRRSSQLIKATTPSTPQQDLTSYVLALLTDDEAGCGNCIPTGENSPLSPAPLRDLQLFGDCELAVLAAPLDQYDAHARLVRQEYAKLSQDNYVELRIRVSSAAF